MIKQTDPGTVRIVKPEQVEQYTADGWMIIGTHTEYQAKQTGTQTMPPLGGATVTNYSTLTPVTLFRTEMIPEVHYLMFRAAGSPTEQLDALRAEMAELRASRSEVVNSLQKELEKLSEQKKLLLDENDHYETRVSGLLVALTEKTDLAKDQEIELETLRSSHNASDLPKLIAYLGAALVSEILGRKVEDPTPPDPNKKSSFTRLLDEDT